MTDSPKRVRKTRAQLDLASALRDFIKSPVKGGALETLCGLIAQYELKARFGTVIEAANVKQLERANTKANDTCRSCGNKLDESNRARVSGYQCLGCTREYKRLDTARRRALVKAATP